MRWVWQALQLGDHAGSLAAHEEARRWPSRWRPGRGRRSRPAGPSGSPTKGPAGARGDRQGRRGAGGLPPGSRGCARPLARERRADPRLPPQPGRQPQPRSAPCWRRPATWPGRWPSSGGTRRSVRALAAEHPGVPDYRRDLAVSHNRVGGLLTLAGRPAEALDELERARSLLEVLVRAGPNVPDYRDILATTLIYSGDALRDLGRSGEARDRLARAVALAEALASAPPKAPCLPRPPGRQPAAAGPAQARRRRHRRGRRRRPPGRRAVRGAAQPRRRGSGSGWPAPGRRCRPPPAAAAPGHPSPSRPAWPTRRWTTSAGPPRRAGATRPRIVTSRRWARSAPATTSGC